MPEPRDAQDVQEMQGPLVGMTSLEFLYIARPEELKPRRVIQVQCTVTQRVHAQSQDNSALKYASTQVSALIIDR